MKAAYSVVAEDIRLGKVTITRTIKGNTEICLCFFFFQCKHDMTTSLDMVKSSLNIILGDALFLVCVANVAQLYCMCV